MGNFMNPEYIEVKDLYQAISGNRLWDARWSEFKDPGEENERLRPYRAAFPILRKLLCSGVRQGTWVTESIEINDQALRARIEQILADVPGLGFDVDILSFKPPLKLFSHEWEDLIAALEAEVEDCLENFLQHMHDIVSSAVLPIIESFHRQSTGSCSSPAVFSVS